MGRPPASAWTLSNHGLGSPLSSCPVSLKSVPRPVTPLPSLCPRFLGLHRAWWSAACPEPCLPPAWLPVVAQRGGWGPGGIAQELFLLCLRASVPRRSAPRTCDKSSRLCAHARASRKPLRCCWKEAMRSPFLQVSRVTISEGDTLTFKPAFSWVAIQTHPQSKRLRLPAAVVFPEELGPQRWDPEEGGVGSGVL